MIAVENNTIVVGDYARAQAAKRGCDALLKRQLETGQHWLQGPALLAALKSMGF
jgi:hypothetical protein